uniref:Uncharacterized protein n=1 Tax=Arundo donax TaxID=35708 RepID=A0A0A9C7E4_ARUDO
MKAYINSRKLLIF